ncbi:hypothetical protein [Flavobacterium sp.]|uniref:hypothetical protein n=1 Tax=Flavobacterium sp. TaxID=239 RepID=UPI004047F725
MDKLIEVKDKYTGIEFDVVYDSNLNFLDVNHPPAKSIQLNLRDFFKKSISSKEIIYWIDFKNINSLNNELALLELNKIVKDLNIQKNKIIVETTSPEFVNKFRKEGYLTAYYLPPYLYTKEKDSLAFYLSEIDNITKLHETDYISFDYKDFSIINSNFPKSKKISWYTGEKNYIKRIPSKIKLYNILLDNNVDYMLLPYKGKSKYR